MQKTVYDAVLWLTEEVRQRYPKVALPHSVSEIVYAAETAKENEQIVPDTPEGSPPTEPVRYVAGTKPCMH